MAITKILNIQGSAKNVLDYIKDFSKTENGIWMSCYGCDENTPENDFELVKELNRKENGARSKDINVAYHIIQNFGKEGMKKTPEELHHIGVRLCKEFLGTDYQYLITTHVDGKFPHNHIVFNSCSMNSEQGYKKFNKHKMVWKKIRKISDRLCVENGLDIIEEKTAGKGKNINEYEMNQKNKKTLRKNLIEAIDEVTPTVNSYVQFKKEMLKKSILVDDAGVHTSYSFVEGNSEKRFRGNNLDSNKKRTFEKLDIIKAINSNISMKAKKTNINTDKLKSFKFEFKSRYSYRRSKYETRTNLKTNTKTNLYHASLIKRYSITKTSELIQIKSQLKKELRELEMKIEDASSFKGEATRLDNARDILNDVRYKEVFEKYSSMKFGRDKFYYANKSKIDSYTKAKEIIEKGNVNFTMPGYNLDELLREFKSIKRNLNGIETIEELYKKYTEKTKETEKTKDRATFSI